MNESITFNVGGLEILRLCDNGDIYVKTHIVTNDQEVVDAFRLWMSTVNRSYGGCIVRHQTIASNQTGDLEIR